MTDQGGYGFRAARVANPWSLSRVAERAAPVERRPLALLLLPCDLEEFALRFSALIDGLMIQVVVGSPHIDRRRMLEMCRQVATAELRPSDT